MKFDFLLSSERSGSNLLTRMLDSHPEICGPAPSHLFRAFSQNLRNYGNLDVPKNWEVLVSDVIFYLNAQLGKWSSALSAEELLNLQKPRSLHNAIRYIYEKEAEANGKNRLFIKENKVFNFSPYLLSVFTDAKFVYLVRDPRDTVLSYKKSANHPGGVEKGTAIWQEDQSRFLELFSYLQDTHRVALICYEDLLSNPEKELKALCEFLQIDFSRQMLNFHQDRLTVANAQRLKNWDNLAKPLLNKNFNKFSKELNDAEIAYIQHVCAKEMTQLGYEHQATHRNYSEDTIEEVQRIDLTTVSIQIELSESEKLTRERRNEAVRRILNRNLK